jgi:hypothetical protein
MTKNDEQQTIKNKAKTNPIKANFIRLYGG